MKTLIITLSLLAVQGGISRGCSNDAYNKQILATGLDRPFLLAVDYQTDTLYFNHNVGIDDYKVARLNLKTNEIKNIDGIPNGFSHAVDSANNLLYIGTKDGIYVYNYHTEKSEFYGARGKFIWTLFFKDQVLYYSEYPCENLYTYANGETARFTILKRTKVRFFLLDKDNVMFFSNRTGLYKQSRGSGEAILYKTFNNSWDLRALTTDLLGNVYAGMKDGIYSVNRHQVQVDQVVALPKCFGLAFDSVNNMIYSDNTSVIRLVPNKDVKC